jgi:hypothetical protein
MGSMMKIRLICGLFILCAAGLAGADEEFLGWDVAGQSGLMFDNWWWSQFLGIIPRPDPDNYGGCGFFVFWVVLVILLFCFLQWLLR